MLQGAPRTVRLSCLHLLCTQCLGDMTADDDRHCFATPVDEGLDCASRFQVDQVVKLQVRLSEEGEHAAKRTKTDDDEGDNQLLATKRGLCEKLLAKLEKGLTNMDTHLAKLATQAADAVEAIDRECQALNERRLQLRKEALDEINTDVKAVQLLRDTLVVGRAHVQLLFASQTIEKDLFIARADTLLGTDYPLFYPNMRSVVKVVFSEDSPMGRVKRSRDYSTLGDPVMMFENEIKSMRICHMSLSPSSEVLLCDNKNKSIHFLSANGLHLHTITTPFMPVQAVVASNGYLWVYGGGPDESGVFILAPDGGTVLKFIKRIDPNEFDCVLKIVPMQNGNVVVTNLDDHFISVFDPTGERRFTPWATLVLAQLRQSQDSYYTFRILRAPMVMQSINFLSRNHSRYLNWMFWIVLLLIAIDSAVASRQTQKKEFSFLQIIEMDMILISQSSTATRAKFNFVRRQTP